MPPHDERRSAINGDHNPSDFAACPGCRQPTYQAVIPTAAGRAIVYVCDACDLTGPRLFIPHIDRFEGGIQHRKNLQRASSLKPARPTSH